MSFPTKKVVLAVSGGIAAYKSAYLVRELVKAHMDVRVVMTANAQKFITPLTFQALSTHEVATDTFQETGGEILHIRLAQWADLVVIAPATANVIGKLANGIADDFLSTFVLATECPMLICPAMNPIMFQNPAVQENLATLKRRGYHLMAVGEGEMACGVEGAGRLAEPEDIMDEIENLLSPKDLAGLRFLITASRTEEYLDPVRCITNPSSGRMGYALAVATRRRGGTVVLVSGPSELPDPRGVKMVRVCNARQMRDAVHEYFVDSDVVIKAAAVSDFRPAGEVQEHKIKKEEGESHLALERNPDILEELGRIKGNRCLIGFAAETEDLLENARLKIRKKNLDFIVANDVSEPEAGFRCETNQVKIIDHEGHVVDVSLASKLEIANSILDRVVQWTRSHAST
jgi:phosphopantothenoylcysteine decarboxylase/phosphopantothenate--cysteine ligase